MTNSFLSLHFDALVIDGHCDSIGDQLENSRWLGDRSDALLRLSGEVPASQPGQSLSLSLIHISEPARPY